LVYAGQQAGSSHLDGRAGGRASGVKRRVQDDDDDDDDDDACVYATFCPHLA
jgi:hypothetical protein